MSRVVLLLINQMETEQPTDGESKEEYARVGGKRFARTSKNAYNLALRDWQKPPVIDSMNVDHDGKVRVSAHDDMMVTKVTITILNEEGQPMERGEAELWMGVWWDYHSTNKENIRVEAWDMAGNVTRQEFCPPPHYFSVWEKTIDR
jgi:hypothetical protein